MSPTPVVVCLGLGLLPDGSLPEMLVERCKVAAEISKEKDLMIINSGGDPRKTGVTEASAMTDFMVTELGVEEKKVWKEEKSISTCTNAKNTLEIFSAGENFIGRNKSFNSHNNSLLLR